MFSVQGRSFLKGLIFFGLCFFSFCAYATGPYIKSASVMASVEQGEKVSYGGDFSLSIDTANPQGTQTVYLCYKLWEQKNGAAWQEIVYPGIGCNERSIMEGFSRRPKPVAIGRYKYRLSVKDDYLGSSWSSIVETDVVELELLESLHKLHQLTSSLISKLGIKGADSLI
jgi:hypothetical protein